MSEVGDVRFDVSVLGVELSPDGGADGGVHTLVDLVVRDVDPHGAYGVPIIGVVADARGGCRIELGLLPSDRVD